jgi:hypothetical protein
MTVTYDGRAEKVVRAANLLRALDVFDRLRFVELDAADAASGASRKEPSRLVVLTPSGPREGWSGLQFAARALPLLWLLALPGLVGGYLKPATRG